MTTKIMLTNEQVQEYLKVILTSGKDFEDMFSIFQRLNYDDYKIAIFKLYNEEISLSEMNNSKTTDSSLLTSVNNYLNNSLLG